MSSIVTANRKNWAYMNKILELESTGLGRFNSLLLGGLQEWKAGHSKRQEEIRCDVEVYGIYQVKFYD